MSELNFNDNRFKIEFEENESYTAKGRDIAKFFISTNVGEPMRPLCEVASGGELSRIMLAIKTVCAGRDLIHTLIFDEIDANIGGETATKVAGEIAVLAASKQILCISHLPQIASRADTHFNVCKESDGEVTHTYIRQLDHAGRVQEIARMLGGGAEAGKLAAKMLSVSNDSLQSKHS